jgi:hypothetical protein
VRILVLGDFSGVNHQLSRALRAAGHDVDFYSRGDGFKDIPAEHRFYVRGRRTPRLLGAAIEVADQLLTVRRLQGYDVAVLHAPFQFHNRLNAMLVRHVLRSNAVVVLQHMACSTAYHSFVRTLAYNPCADCARLDHGGVPCSAPEFEKPQWEDEVYRRADAIVCTGFEYHEAMRRQPHLAARVVAVPLPVDLSEHPFQPVPRGGPVRILYGTNREGFKGSAHIRPALARLEVTHGQQVEIEVAERLPYATYLSVLQRAHVLVDQCNTYSYGMNAVLAAARGKVVLTGAEPQALATFAMPADCPLINIRPDPQDIWERLVEVVEAGDEWLVERAAASREFVRRYHDSTEVAAQYLELFRRLRCR